MKLIRRFHALKAGSALDYYTAAGSAIRLNQMMAQKKGWVWEIAPELFGLKGPLRQLWSDRQWLPIIVRRDLPIHNQQTLWGPLWIIFQPINILVIYLLFFEKAAELSTDGLLPTLFYQSGLLLWTLFAQRFTGTAFTFIQNKTLFEKVNDSPVNITIYGSAYVAAATLYGMSLRKDFLCQHDTSYQVIISASAVRA